MGSCHLAMRIRVRRVLRTAELDVIGEQVADPDQRSFISVPRPFVVATQASVISRITAWTPG
jgi:hypothetical protein